MTKAFILNFLSQHKDEFFQKYGVTKIGLFGSYVRDDFKEESDIDIAIEMLREKKSLNAFFSLKRELEEAFNLKVDLGIESSLKPIAKEKILKEIVYV
ncbi:MAG: nucleotidyltransferase family protein [Sulfurimonas sp.]|uniref:nucleotidyltransferase family protein n=1 Tax=Sulfurimonas sp. TaxID=2022749 RepID=UPI002619C3C7|nr:nucleotidyltransferase family protein [Sulfurimonas sp.]MDD5400951.1 nucleotidyltransferase family protein [Sulfurimonas sp.]